MQNYHKLSFEDKWSAEWHGDYHEVRTDPDENGCRRTVARVMLQSDADFIVAAKALACAPSRHKQPQFTLTHERDEQHYAGLRAVVRGPGIVPTFFNCDEGSVMGDTLANLVAAANSAPSVRRPSREEIERLKFVGAVVNADIRLTETEAAAAVTAIDAHNKAIDFVLALFDAEPKA